ncbi:MAG: hypothetical protein ACTSX8_08980, partial [Alphaproteobacteria bacterium]
MSVNPFSMLMQLERDRRLRDEARRRRIGEAALRGAGMAQREEQMEALEQWRSDVMQQREREFAGLERARRETAAAESYRSHLQEMRDLNIAMERARERIAPQTIKYIDQLVKLQRVRSTNANRLLKATDTDLSVYRTLLGALRERYKQRVAPVLDKLSDLAREKRDVLDQMNRPGVTSKQLEAYSARLRDLDDNINKLDQDLRQQIVGATPEQKPPLLTNVVDRVDDLAKALGIEQGQVANYTVDDLINNLLKRRGAAASARGALLKVGKESAALQQMIRDSMTEQKVPPQDLLQYYYLSDLYHHATAMSPDEYRQYKASWAPRLRRLHALQWEVTDEKGLPPAVTEFIESLSELAAPEPVKRQLKQVFIDYYKKRQAELAQSPELQ